MRKQFIFYLAALSLLWLTLAACGEQDSPSTTGLPNVVTQRDPDFGVTVSYAEDWIVHNSIGGLTIASSQSVIDSDSMANIGDNGFVLIIPGEIDVLNFQSNQSITEDKPIMLDYLTGSLDKQVLIGMRESGEKLLVKSEDEYTSPIAKIFKVEWDFIVLTENSIYLVSSDVETKRIS